jgi:hypothetical protein
VLPGESAAEFAALEASLLEELAPQGALQAVLARRVVAAAWRLERAERIEAELFEHYLRGDRNLGVALIRDGNGARSFDTLLRYRGGTLAELWRALRTLKALQAEQAARAEAAVVAEREDMPIEPEARRIPGESDPAAAVQEPEPDLSGRPDAKYAEPHPGAQPEPRDHLPASRERPIEPKQCSNPGETVFPPAKPAEEARFPGAGRPAVAPVCEVRRLGLPSPPVGTTPTGSQAGSPGLGRSGR